MENNADELIRIMHERFLMGEDKGLIDYESIDTNEYFALSNMRTDRKYDNKRLMELDAEEKFFEAEEPQAEEPMKKQKIYTGELDY